MESRYELNKELAQMLKGGVIMDVTTPEQAHAYIWMILQPYASLDGFCIALLSDREKETLYKLAGRTPEAFRALKKMMHAGNDRLDELPGMLMEIFIATL